MIWNFCIRRPVFTIIIFVVATIFGIYGYSKMPVQENPDVEFPIVSVMVVLPGAAPSVIESEIIEQLESEINTIEGLRLLTSSARQQVGSIMAEFELWRDIDVAAQDVRDAVDRAARLLPRDVEAPIVRKIDIGAQPILWIALTGDQRWDAVRLTGYADNILKQRLETLPGVGQILIGGQRKYAVRIKLDPERLAAHHLTIQEVVRAVEANNVDIPSGRIEGEKREFLIQTRGQFSSAAPFNDIIVAHREGASIRLSDVGEAVDGIEDDRQLARFSGEITVGLGVVKQADANTVAMAKAIRDRMTIISGDFPPGLDYSIATDSSEYVEESIRDLLYTIVIATSLVVLVVLAFLRSVRGTFITVLAIPTSLVIGLALISQLGFSINILSMLALILVIGIVIDDAIVVLERCYLHMEEGAEAMPAARVGTTEVAFPSIANTLALAAVFIPVAFTSGIIGRFFLEFGVTATVTVVASTFVALSLTPMLCSRILGVSQRHGPIFYKVEKIFKSIDRGYQRLLGLAFKHRGLTILIGIASFVVGILALLGTSREFAAAEDRSAFMIIFETPQGATLSETDEFAREIEKNLAQMPEIQHQFLAVGLQQGAPGRPNRGMAFIRLVPRSERKMHQQEVMQTLRERLDKSPLGRAFAMEFTPGGMGGSPIEIILKHPDINELAKQQEKVMAWMRSHPELYVGVRTNLELNNPQVDVNILRDKAAQLGISVADIATSLRYVFGSAEISTIEREARRYKVITDVANRGNLVPKDLVRNLYLRTTSGDLVALDNIVQIDEAVGPSEIHRHNRMRAAKISAENPPDVALGDAVEKLSLFLEQELPDDFEYDLGGLSEVFAESFYYLTVAVLFSIVFIYLVLAAQLESFILPLTIMTSLPLATVGAFGALWIFGLTFNIYAFIGLIMLLGLVTKNAILIVDYTNVLVARGMEPTAAAKESARVRFRPVLMTATSTILGMAPLAIGFGAAGEALIPLGVTVMAGMITSTFLTLLIVPVIYTLVANASSSISRFIGSKLDKLSA